MGAMGEPGVIHTTEQRVLRSTAASYVIQLARLAVTFGAKIVLARLILPEGHGVYELALRIVTVASALRDLGLPYHLVRDERRPYGTVLAVFLLAAMAGLIVRVPGGLGVLEAVFIALLSHRVPEGQLLGALLAYRALYYMLPLGIASLMYLRMELAAKRQPSTSS